MTRHFRIASIMMATIILACTMQPAAQAHVLESDGGISAVLHIPPDDTPRAGQATAVNLAFASNDSTFNISSYRLQASLKRGDETVQTAAMRADRGSSRDATTDMSFPQAGAYILQIEGVPTAAGQSFSLEFSVRAVGSDDSSSGFGQTGFDFWAISLGSLVVLTLLARHQIRLRGRYNHKPN